jgi:hypothetical protein
VLRCVFVHTDAPAAASRSIGSPRAAMTASPYVPRRTCGGAGQEAHDRADSTCIREYQCERLSCIICTQQCGSTIVAVTVAPGPGPPDITLGQAAGAMRRSYLSVLLPCVTYLRCLRLRARQHTVSNTQQRGALPSCAAASRTAVFRSHEAQLLHEMQAHVLAASSAAATINGTPREYMPKITSLTLAAAGAMPSTQVPFSLRLQDSITFAWYSTYYDIVRFECFVCGLG